MENHLNVVPSGGDANDAVISVNEPNGYGRIPENQAVPIRNRVSLRQSYITIFSYILLITLSEITVAYYEPSYGIVLHGSLMFILFGHAALLNPSDRDLSNLLMAIGIAPLIRIISLSTPLSSFSYIYWFLILSVPLFAGIIILRYVQKLKEEDIGLTLNFRKLHLEIGIVLAGIPLGFLEYYILKPEPLIDEFTIQRLVASVLIMVICTGLIKELIFRGLIQHNAVRVFGVRGGIAATSILFGLLHIGNLSPPSVVFAAAVGVLFSIVVLRTKSIAGVSIAHGTLNCTLFLIVPTYFG